MDRIKKKRNEEEQVRLQEVLHEFSETFDETTKPINKLFLRGEVVQAGSKTVSSGGSVYKPAPIAALTKRPVSLEAAKKKAEETAKKIMEEAQKKKVPSNRPPKPGSNKVTQKTKMTNLEMFKEELKQLQEMRQERRGLRDQLKTQMGVSEEDIDKIAPSLDNPYLNGANNEFDVDSHTTNLYLCNLPMDIKLEDLYETFGSYGPLASAKVLYPRPDENRFRDSLTGFVAFMTRVDAERALNAMAGERLNGNEIKVSWARPVVIPPTPFYVPYALQQLAMPDPPTGLPFNAKPISDDLKKFLKKYKELPRLNAPLPDDLEMLDDYKEMINHAVVRVVIPTERPLLMLIHRTIEFMVREGPLFEAMLMGKERANPMFRFLFDNHHPTHVYFRWKLYSVLQGDDLRHWRLERFKMFNEGSWWEPPPHSLFNNGMPPQLYNTAYVPKRKRQAERERKRRRHSRSAEPEPKKLQPPKSKNWEKITVQEEKRRGALSATDRNEFEDLLRNLDPEKCSIGDAMIWCLEHADCAKEIAHCIYESLTIDETPLHKKLARVYLISDILANCGVRVKDVFYYRQHFGDVLQKVFKELNRTYEKIDSRIKAEQFRQRVMLCFRMWEDNVIYPTEILINYQNIFLGLAKAMPVDNPLASAMDVDEDIDGAPLEEESEHSMDEDIDGAPLEEDVYDDKYSSTSRAAYTYTKEPVFKEEAFKETSWDQVDVSAEPRVTTSKWEELEEAEGASRMEDEDIDGIPLDEDESYISHSQEGHGLESLYGSKADISTHSRSPSPTPVRTQEYEEKRRQLLREVEMKVMAYQDELENEGDRNIEEECQKYRQKLMKKMDEQLEKLTSTPKKQKEHKKKKNKDKDKEKEHDEEKERRRSREKENKKERRESLSEENGRERRDTHERERDRDRHRDSRKDDRDRERTRDFDREDRNRDDWEKNRDYDSRGRESDRRDSERDRPGRRDRSPERRRR